MWKQWTYFVYCTFYSVVNKVLHCVTHNEKVSKLRFAVFVLVKLLKYINFGCKVSSH